MKLRRGIFSSAIAIATGLIILLGAVFPIALLQEFRVVLLQWAVLVAGMAVLVGIANLLMTHISKIRAKKDRLYSLLLVIALLVSMLVTVIFTPQGLAARILFEGIILPVEATLMGLVAISLLYASIRMLRHRTDLLSIVFIGTAVVLLLGTAPLPFGEIGILNYIVRPFLAQVPAAAGARGILIGVALGTLTTGLRILFGADRPYGGK